MAVSEILRSIPAVAERWHVSMHELWKTGSELDRQLAEFSDADVLVRQDLRNWLQHPLHDTLPEALHVVAFPFVYMAALWPFDSFIAGQDSPMLQAMAAHKKRSSEPIPFGFQDGMLRRLRSKIADSDERLRRYSTLEFDNAPDISDYAEFEEARLLNDDTRLGFEIGRYVVGNYRQKRLFHAITHPVANIIERLAWEILCKLGIEMALEEIPQYVNGFMSSNQVPVHPKVIEALDLTWVTLTSRYTQPSGMSVTFSEYFQRYAYYPVED